MFDLDGQQCNVTADCAGHGVVSAECREHVCVAIQGSGGTGGQQNQGGHGGAGTGGGNGGSGGEPPLPENFACLDGFTAPDPGK